MHEINIVPAFVMRLDLTLSLYLYHVLISFSIEMKFLRPNIFSSFSSMWRSIDNNTINRFHFDEVEK